MKTMKKTLNMMLAMMAGAIAFTACSSDDILENIENNELAEVPSLLKPMTFTAVQEGEGGTRTAIATDADGKANGINWTAGDKISIFDGAAENGGVQMFELATGENTTSATFNGRAADAATYYALYPYAVGEISTQVNRADAVAAYGGDEHDFERIEEDWNFFSDMFGLWDAEHNAKDRLEDSGVSEANQAIILAYLKRESKVTPGVKIDGSSIKNVVIPAEQTATAGSADPKAMIMIAKGDDTNTLQFKNVCAFVKVTPQFDCFAIDIASKGSEQLAGKVTINYNDGNPTTTVTADGTTVVTLRGTITAGNTYYIAVRPETLASGFSIDFLTADKTTCYARSTSKPLALARSNVKNLGEFTTTGTWTTNSPVIGTANGHSWKLITPTLRMATSVASGPVAFDDIPTSWGKGWVLPTAEELLYLCQNKSMERDESSVKLHGVGVLKYASDIDLETMLSWYWTSTPDGSDQFVVTPSGSAVSQKKEWANSVLFKYNTIGEIDQADIISTSNEKYGDGNFEIVGI